jgi:hypothetical protein
MPPKKIRNPIGGVPLSDSTQLKRHALQERNPVRRIQCDLFIPDSFTRAEHSFTGWPTVVGDGISPEEEQRSDECTSSGSGQAIRVTDDAKKVGGDALDTLPGGSVQTRERASNIPRSQLRIEPAGLGNPRTNPTLPGRPIGRLDGDLKDRPHHVVRFPNLNGLG